MISIYINIIIQCFHFFLSFHYTSVELYTPTNAHFELIQLVDTVFHILSVIYLPIFMHRSRQIKY